MKGFAHESTYNESKEWYTPPIIFDCLNLEFDLDPCSPVNTKTWVPAKKKYTVLDNGLMQPWAGLVWMNPPYGTDTPVWMKRLCEHGNGVALVFARTDTQWFHEYATKAHAICFVSGRIKFMKPDGTEGGTPGAGSLLIGYGETAAQALKDCGLGFTVRLK